jgi:hypothetical protein
VVNLCSISAFFAKKDEDRESGAVGVECPAVVGRWAGAEVLPTFLVIVLEDGWRSVDDACKTRFISCCPSADHRSTVTKQERAIQVTKNLTQVIIPKFKT